MAEQPKSYEKVLTYLEDSLRRGQLSLGDPLPPERELAEQLGISRNSVREAVRLLEHMGFIVSNQGAGNFICCNIQRNLQDSFDLLMLLQQIDYRRLGELRAAQSVAAPVDAAVFPVKAVVLEPLVGMAGAGSTKNCRAGRKRHQ